MFFPTNNQSDLIDKTLFGLSTGQKLCSRSINLARASPLKTSYIAPLLLVQVPTSHFYVAVYLLIVRKNAVIPFLE